MKINIYCRVSSVKQQNNSSFLLQLNKCKKYINEHYTECEKNIYRKKYKEVCSAYNKKPPILTRLINEKNNIIIMSNINRFSRSIIIGKELIIQCIENNNTIIFVDNDIVFSQTSEYNQMENIIKLIKIAESESNVISYKVKNIKKYYKQNNKYTGGGLKYGYIIINNFLVEDYKEMLIVNFITLVKLNNLYVSKKIIVDFIKNNSKITNKQTIENIINSIKSSTDNIQSLNKCKINRNNKNIYLSHKNIYLSHKNICQLFNKCNIKYRGARWTTVKIKQIEKNQLKKVNEMPNIKKNEYDVLPLFKQFKKMLFL
jgi:DNA invertase Pin-like site-specific DNA recombinase